MEHSGCTLLRQPVRLLIAHLSFGAKDNITAEAAPNNLYRPNGLLGKSPKKKTVTVAVSVSIWEFSRPGTIETRNARA